MPFQKTACGATRDYEISGIRGLTALVAMVTLDLVALKVGLSKKESGRYQHG